MNIWINSIVTYFIFFPGKYYTAKWFGCQYKKYNSWNISARKGHCPLIECGITLNSFSGDNLNKKFASCSQDQRGKSLPFFKFPCKNGFQIWFRQQHRVRAINFHVQFFCFYNFSLLSITCMRRAVESLISLNSVHASFFLFPLADIKAKERAVFFRHSHEHALFV